jgi:hypothetical protein
MKKPVIDQETLKRLLEYNPDTGVFIWKSRPDGAKRWNARYAGKVAGFHWTPRGSRVAYVSIRIFDWPFLGHRLAWLYMTGEWPAEAVDHKDLDGLNNRWENLRPATKAQNGANTRAPRTNSSGFKGVSLHKPTGKYRAYIKIGERQVWLGYHDTAEAAHAAYAAAAKSMRGEYARAS